MSDPERRQAIGESGRAVAARFTPDAVQQRFAEEYRRCIDEHNSGRLKHESNLCLAETP
jgi:hypothetical protein